MRQGQTRDIISGNSRTSGKSQGSCGQPGGVGSAFVNMPIIGAEDIWEYGDGEFGQPRNKTEVRRGAWGEMLAGVMPLYSEWAARPPAAGYGNGEGEPEVRRMFDFVYTKTNYRRYQQLNNLVSSEARQIASGIPGQEYLVYDEDGGSMTIDLSVASGTFSVLWFDPTTGAEQSGGSVPGGTPTEGLVSPFSGDTVLFLSSGSGSQDTTPPAAPTNLRVVEE